MVGIPAWLQIAFGVAAMSQPFIVLMLTVAHQDRKELLNQVSMINGRIGVLEDWRSSHERWKEAQIMEIKEHIADLENRRLNRG